MIKMCATFRRPKLEAKLCLAAVLALAGCGADEQPALPLSCKEGPEPILTALVSAPGRVELDGVPISDCLRDASDAADVQTVGAALVSATGTLVDEARGDPGGEAELRLGYLMGAARAGAADSQGIHDELVRRLELELRLLNTESRAFRTGEQAGRRSG